MNNKYGVEVGVDGWFARLVLLCKNFVSGI